MNNFVKSEYTEKHNHAFLRILLKKPRIKIVDFAKNVLDENDKRSLIITKCLAAFQLKNAA